jgi:hypothetical protein
MTPEALARVKGDIDRAAMRPGCTVCIVWVEDLRALVAAVEHEERRATFRAQTTQSEAVDYADRWAVTDAGCAYVAEAKGVA